MSGKISTETTYEVWSVHRDGSNELCVQNPDLRMRQALALAAELTRTPTAKMRGDRYVAVKVVTKREVLTDG